MSRYESTQSFVVTLEVNTKNDAFLEKYFRVANQIYNGCLDTAKKRLNRLSRDPEYQMLVKNRSIKNRSKRIREKQLEYGYTEYQLHEKVAEMKHHFSDIIGIDECQKQATKAFRAVERLRFHESDRVRHHSLDNDCSVEGKSKNSALYVRNGLLYIGRKHKYELIVKDDDRYAKEALADSRLKYVRLKRCTIRGKARYFAQLVLKGIPPQKYAYGPKEVVTGLDVGTSTVAEVSEVHAELHRLAPQLQEIDSEVRRLNRAMDRSRRSTNSQYFNKDGTVKRGKKTWYCSNRYLTLRNRRRELYRKRAILLKESHQKLANDIISRSTTVILETMNYRALQKRSKAASINRKNGRFNRRSRFGKALQNAAPSMFESILDRKLHYIGSSLIYTDTAKIRASQVNHVTGEYIKKDLSVRMFEIDGHIVQRDLYSAFITGHTYPSTENEKNDSIDYEGCRQDFNNFLVLQDFVINTLKSNKDLTWYIS